MNKGIKALVVVAAAIGISASSYAAAITVNWAAFAATGVSLEGAGISAVPTGDLVEIGYFTIAPTPGSSSLANFVPFGSTTTFGVGGFDGFWQGHASSADEVPFSGQQIYIVAFNAATAGAATQEGIFTSSLGTWKFPSSTPPATTGIELQDLVVNPTGPTPTLAGTASILFGSGPFTDGAGSAYLKLQTIVPEPSTVALVGLGMLGMIGFIRRRRS